MNAGGPNRAGPPCAACQPEFTDHDLVAGVGSVFPAASVALTLNSCLPRARPAYVAGEEHGTNSAPSSEHSNVLLSSVDENENVALLVFTEPFGPASMRVSGGSVSRGTAAPAIRMLRKNTSSGLPGPLEPWFWTPT